MIKYKSHLVSLVVLGHVIFSCTSPTSVENNDEVPVVTAASSQFNNYWYAGKAEITSYQLEQSRYGEVHNGDAVLIFVTEPFSKSKQVKLDYADRAGDDKMTVLKLNYTKKFNTGIYPYSMMLSSFTPVDSYNFKNTSKVTASIQEWCGHVFTQMNLIEDNYKVNAYSYFEQEGDKSFEIEKGLLEDEVFNKIRLDYKSLPVGEVEMIPGLFFTRLKHENLKPQKVSASLLEGETGMTYTIDFKKDKRILEIRFNKEFPHNILGWTETYRGIGGKELSTTAVAKKTLFIDYWAKNNVSDTYLRDSLDLSY